MITRLKNKIKYSLNPPKNGEVFYSDPLFFVINKPIEFVLFGLKNKYGKTMWHPIPSFGCFKLKIVSSSMQTYYKCEASVLCNHNDDLKIKDWKKRVQEKRIDKRAFKEMLLDGTLVRVKNA